MELIIGANYYTNGCKVRLIDTPTKKSAHVAVIEDFRNYGPLSRASSSCLIVSANNLHRMCTDLFNVDDRVSSTLKRYDVKKAFEGIVTGFELPTNRIICRPIGEDDDSRKRYAYYASEIERADGAYFHFKDGSVYIINNMMKVVARKISNGFVNLVVNDSYSMYSAVPVKIIKPMLAMSHGITKVEEISR